MKTITEFTGNLLRAAQSHRKAPVTPEPAPEVPAADASPADSTAIVTEVAPVLAEASADPVAVEPNEPTAEASAAVEGDAAEAGEGGEAAAVEAAPEAPKPDPNLVSPEDAEAIGAALNVSGDRLARMCDALAATAKKLPQVQRVRIVQLAENEAAPAGAKKQGDYYVIVDLAPRPAQGGGRDDRRGGGRGGERGGRGGPGGGGGGGRGGPGGSGAGGRGGPGGGRGGPGGKGFGSMVYGSGPTAKKSGKVDEAANAEEPQGRDLPSAGLGWMLQRAPKDPNERGRGGRPGGRGRDGERRGRGPGGPPGDRPGGGRPGGGRGPGGPGGPGGGRGAAGGPGGGRGPGGPGGGRGPGGPGGGRGPGGGSRGPRGSGSGGPGGAGPGGAGPSGAAPASGGAAPGEGGAPPATGA